MTVPSGTIIMSSTGPGALVVTLLQLPARAALGAIRPAHKASPMAESIIFSGMAKLRIGLVIVSLSVNNTPACWIACKTIPCFSHIRLRNAR